MLMNFESYSQGVHHNIVEVLGTTVIMDWSKLYRQMILFLIKHVTCAFVIIVNEVVTAYLVKL